MTSVISVNLASFALSLSVSAASTGSPVDCRPLLAPDVRFSIAAVDMVRTITLIRNQFSVVNGNPVIVFELLMTAASFGNQYSWVPLARVRAGAEIDHLTNPRSVQDVLRELVTNDWVELRADPKDARRKQMRLSGKTVDLILDFLGKLDRRGRPTSPYQDD